MNQNKKTILKIHIQKALEAFRKEEIDAESVTYNLEQAIIHIEDIE